MKYLLIINLLFILQAQAKQPRSYHAIKQFKIENPCPASGRYKGRCEGNVIDHVVPLACVGLDSLKNMQCQTLQAARSKDKLELSICRNT